MPKESVRFREGEEEGGMGNKTAISMTKKEKKEGGEQRVTKASTIRTDKGGKRKKKKGKRNGRKRRREKERGSLKVDKEITKKTLHAEESRKRDTRETITSTS